MGSLQTRQFDFSKRSQIRKQQSSTIVTPSLASFVESTTGFAVEPWQQIICDRLEQLARGETGARILIHGPPQFGKSIIISQRFPCYVLGVNPIARLRVACYNVTHAERFSKVNLALMQMPEYRAVFPRSEVPQRVSYEEWSTTARAALLDANPSFKPLGLGTGFTGMGVDTLVIDDPYKNRDEARSEAINTSLWGWWTDVVLPRLNPATNIVVMFHRWWEGDFAGKLIDEGGWELLRFPAIADDGKHDPTVMGPKAYRAEGEALSNRYPLAYLESMKKTQGDSFYALYQGTPYPASGNMFKAGKAEIVKAAPINAKRVRRWDTASTSGGGDYTAGVLMCRASDGSYYVEDVVRGQWSTDDRDAKIRETAGSDHRRYQGKVKQIGPQDPGSAGKDAALAFIRNLDGFTVEIERESGDKVTRADPMASQWNVGNIKLVEGEWNEPYLNEMLAFPNGKNDDQVDGSSGAFNELAPDDDGFSFSYEVK